MTTRSPFDGAPPTSVSVDKEGKRTFLVRPRFLTPWRYKVARFLAKSTALGLSIAGAIHFNAIEDPLTLEVLVSVGTPWIALPIWQAIFGQLTSRKIRIELTEEHVTVTRALRRSCFDRLLTHKFSLLVHDATMDERRRQSLEAGRKARRGKQVIPKPVYGNSFHLSYDYLGQRNDLMTIYSQKTAMQILTRLIACDEVLNAQCGHGEGYAIDPDDDWKPTPGALN